MHLGNRKHLSRPSIPIIAVVLYHSSNFFSCSCSDLGKIHLKYINQSTIQIVKVIISYITIIIFLFGSIINGHLFRIDNAFGDGLFMEQLSASLDYPYY